MKVLITGATGLIGKRLAERYHQPMVTSRVPGRVAGAHPPGHVLQWPLTETSPEPEIPLDAVFHLAGEPVAGARWSAERMARIRSSRVEGTRDLVDWLAGLEHRPRVLVCASAIGYYGDRGDQELTENSAPGDSFLAEVCEQWEAEAQRAEALGIRVVQLRIGIVLSKSGGALAEMMTPFKLGVGGPLGSGDQWMSWVHIDDLLGLLQHAAEAEVSGPMNGVAPGPIRNRDFSKAFARALGRPSFLKAPAFALKIALGKMSDIVLASQKVSPQVALASGYQFQYVDLAEALRACLAEDK
jgi:uncharacterized protein